MSLLDSLPLIAAEVLHNTHVGRQNMKKKFRLIEKAYGEGTVKDDFREWCHEVQDKNPRYPLTEYVKVVDERLGPKFAEHRPDIDDPRIAEISSTCYEETGFLPSVRSVAKLLVSITPEDIISAMKEYAGTLDENDLKSGMKTFFTDAGALAVVLARRRRSGE